MTDNGHDFQVIDDHYDPAEMCNNCLACNCCEPEKSTEPCKGEPSGYE